MGVGPVAFIGTLAPSVAFGYFAHKAQKEIRAIEDGSSPVAPRTGTPRERAEGRRPEGQAAER